MHVAEQPAEVEESFAEYGCRPVELLNARESSTRALPAFTRFTGRTRKSAFLSQGAVCACPTTERNLGDGAVPADRLYAAGAGICFGSDSNLQIDLLEDARLLEYHLRMNRLERVMLTRKRRPMRWRGGYCGAPRKRERTSLGAPGGTLEIGRAADFFTVDLQDPSIAGAGQDALSNHLVFAMERTAVRDVCVDGEMLVRDGRHALQEEIVRDFIGVQRDLPVARAAQTGCVLLPVRA